VIKVNISYELLIYQDNTAVTLKMQNTILKKSRKAYMHNTTSPPNQNFDVQGHQSKHRLV